MNRRKFTKKVGLSISMFHISGLVGVSCSMDDKKHNDLKIGNMPLFVSTWRHGIEANETAMNVMHDGGSILDAVERGVMTAEADIQNTSVGIGGMPDRDGHVTLDACIMDSHGNAGSVCFLQHIVHPISVARKVMEDTPHVMLAGEGAHRFAISKGFERKKLLSASAKKALEVWQKKKGLPTGYQHRKP